ncbi:MAG TPA: glycosyltransferase N-terminal domain-containing protein [Longimicrobiaceae bacterium]|nr:glycosyltransferase N-terminal domain-containing protein [Longimicrobiaceae bacterium]
MTIPERLYTTILHATAAATPLFVRGEGKVARSLRGRIGVVERFRSWAESGRDLERPLVWFHAPSVGEGLQARAVVEAFRGRAPDVQVAYTFFSPSAAEFARTVPADFIDYLPFDLPREVSTVLDLIGPEVIAFSKTDVWPNLTRLAGDRGVRMALLSATLPAGSSRLAFPARKFLTPAYSRLDHVAAIDADDAERFGALGVAPARRSVMGDARFDQVWSRAKDADLASPLLAPLSDQRATLVAGSTWPADEDRLIAAVDGLRATGHSPRLILVPHEPTEEHLAGSEKLLSATGLSHCRLSAALMTPGAPSDVVLVDRIGVLGDLYALADFAYVGGGFGTAGLHSVLEPAAFGAPVLFGPRHQNARDAAALIRAGGAFEVTDTASLLQIAKTFLEEDVTRSAAGTAAQHYVKTGLGAAERGAEIVATLLRARRTI